MKLCRRTGLSMMRRHSRYFSQELATLALFSNLLSQDEKTQLVQTIKSERGAILLTSLPRSVKEISISHTFFQTSRIDDSFLDMPVFLDMPGKIINPSRLPLIRSKT